MDLKSIKIRDYRDNDYEAVAELLRQTRLFDPDTDTRENLLEMVIRDPGSIIVAEDQGQIVGDVFLVYNGWVPLVFRLAVREDHRKHGLGGLLMKEADDRLKRRGAKEVWIFVDDTNAELKEFYQHLGFTPTGVYRFMYQGLGEK